MTDTKIILRDIVEMFYHSPFKIFNVNSTDGETIVKPFGHFISLGITTSGASINQIKEYIENSDYGFQARVVELKSTRSERYGDYVNSISSVETQKYVSEPPEDLKVYEQDEVDKLISEIDAEIEEGIYDRAPFKQKLQDTLKKITNWEDYALQVKDFQPGVFHRYINYCKKDNSEYRIGIYVTKD